jgi:hypothetical protein
MNVFRVQRGGGHRYLPEAREEPFQEAVHAPRHHAEVQVSQEQQQVTGGGVLLIILIIVPMRIRGSGAFLTPGSWVWDGKQIRIRDPE